MLRLLFEKSRVRSNSDRKKYDHGRVLVRQHGVHIPKSLYTARFTGYHQPGLAMDDELYVAILYQAKNEPRPPSLGNDILEKS